MFFQFHVFLSFQDLETCTRGRWFALMTMNPLNLADPLYSMIWITNCSYLDEIWSTTINWGEVLVQYSKPKCKPSPNSTDFESINSQKKYGTGFKLSLFMEWFIPMTCLVLGVHVWSLLKVVCPWNVASSSSHDPSSINPICYVMFINLL